MPRLRKFVRLSAAEQRLLITAALLLAAMRLALWVLPFATLRRMVARLARTPSRARRGAPHSPERVGWAVQTAGRSMPACGNCLAQALTAHVLLRRLGYENRLRLGVARGAASPLEAHAWVESGGAVLVGAGAVARYTPFPEFERVEDTP